MTGFHVESSAGLFVFGCRRRNGADPLLQLPKRVVSGSGDDLVIDGAIALGQQPLPLGVVQKLLILLLVIEDDRVVVEDLASEHVESFQEQTLLLRDRQRGVVDTLARRQQKIKASNRCLGGPQETAGLHRIAFGLDNKHGRRCFDSYRIAALAQHGCKLVNFAESEHCYI